MRRTPPASTSWLLAVVLPLLGACGPTDVGEDLRALGDYQDGLITFYDADGSGHCSFDPSADLDVAAMNGGQYQDGAVCGACVEVEGPKGTLRVRIVDSCPDCPTKGHLDLSRSAFAKVADPVAGRVNVRWRMVSCNVEGPVLYHFDTGSHQWWAGIQLRNHRLPVTKLEAWKNDAWVALERKSHNYFIFENAGTGTLRVRVTAWDGQTLEDTLPGVLPGQNVSGKSQFK